MRRFKFHLASVLRIRKEREQDALRLFSAAQRAHQEELLKKQDLLKELEKALVRRERLGSVSVEIAAFHIEQSYIVGTHHRIKKADQAIFRASKNVEKAFKAYLNARKQTEMLEKLKERRFIEFRREEMKRELKQLDDLTIMRTGFKSEFDLLQTEVDE